jgi:hypothetical protein
MKIDSVVKDLQKEKTELESKLKNVNVALAALTKLGAKPVTTSLESKTEDRTTPQATAVMAGSAQPANRPAGT